MQILVGNVCIFPQMIVLWFVECDSRDLADAMARLMQMPPAARNSLGESARQAVIQRFSLEPVLDRWEELYLELLIRSPRPHRRGNDHVRTHLFAHRSTT